jgi:hypothetical protein
MTTTTAIKKAAKKTKTELVIITWIGEHDIADGVNTLAYNNGEGLVRVYERDRYDGRCDDTVPGSTLPFFDDAREALAWMATHRGKSIQLSVRAAKMFGWQKHELADV